jgi:hypothetical protein
VLRRFVRDVVRAAGFEVRRLDQSPERPAELFEDPLAALHHARAGVPAAFTCRLQDICDPLGFSFAADGWHPWVAEVVDQSRRASDGFEGSYLERYFESFQPRTALEALPGFVPDGPCGLSSLPNHLFWLAPWEASSVDALDAGIREWIGRGARERGLVDFDLARDGNPYHGPVSRELGEVEVRRLRAVTTALRAAGYDRRFGDSLVYLVRRGRELRVVKYGSGYHRTAAMAALGHVTIPARLRPPHAVDVVDVDDWPQVRSGMWSRTAALRYVDHLFDFDAVAWARDRSLTSGGRQPPEHPRAESGGN